jgi:peptide/nickel transport system substrate-binding protein
MRANRFTRALAATAVAALTVSGLAVVGTAPAGAATKSTVTILSTGDINSLNSSTSDGNTTYNAQVGALTGMGFLYYDSDTKLVMNKAFGSMKIVKKLPKDFQVQYTVAKGQVWSDGTPIDAVDLLLTHVISSGKYSIAAKLGDPAKVTPSFDSVGYGGTYSEHVVGNPVLSADKMSLTVKFDKPLPDWELLAPGPSPVHALELMHDGKKGLQPAAANLAAKAKFLSDFTSKSSRLKKMGTIWTNDYNVTKVDASTNKLLLISNGGFIVSSAPAGMTSVTLARNPKYTSGPKMQTKNPINKVVIKVIKDNTAAVQALRNGDIDVYYNTLPTAADKTALSGNSNVVVTTKVAGNYSHLALRVDSANGKTDDYRGPFAGSSQKAKDLRKAFLLATPRQQMVDTLIKPVSSTAKTMDTQFAFTGSPEYNAITKASGVAQFNAGTQATRTAAALALVKKYYPSAASGSDSVTVRFAHANTTLRNALAALIKAEVEKAGFKVVDLPYTDLFGENGNTSAENDVTMYGFGLTSVSQANSTEVYKSDGGSNVWGWRNDAIDTLTKSLQGEILTPAQITAKRIAVDKLVISNYWGLPLYQNPTIAAYNKALKGIDPAPIGANIVWNFFEWHY